MATQTEIIAGLVDMMADVAVNIGRLELIIDKNKAETVLTWDSGFAVCENNGVSYIAGLASPHAMIFRNATEAKRFVTRTNFRNGNNKRPAPIDRRIAAHNEIMTSRKVLARFQARYDELTGAK